MNKAAERSARGLILIALALISSLAFVACTTSPEGEVPRPIRVDVTSSYSKGRLGDAQASKGRYVCF